MPIGKPKKHRGPYDKMIKHAVELLRQELAPIKEGQQRLLAQNEKITEYIRQLWDEANPREAGEEAPKSQE